MKNNKEPKQNIVITCKECSAKLYSNKGKFTKEQVQKAEYVKKEFNGEHMWIEILEHTDLGVLGTVNNDPELDSSPKCGTPVFVAYAEIEEIS